MLEYKPNIYNKCEARFLNSRNIYAAHSLTHTYTYRERDTLREQLIPCPGAALLLLLCPTTVSRALTNEHYL